MRLLALLLSCVLVASATLSPTVKKICEGGVACYSEPENCQLSECRMILIFYKHGTEIYINDYDYTEYFVLYTEKSGVRQDNIFSCFAGVASCFHGVELENKPTVYKNRQQVTMHTISEFRGQFVYDLPRVVVETGADIEYSYVTGFPGELDKDTTVKKLYKVKGPGDFEIKHNIAKNAKDVALKYGVPDKKDAGERVPKQRRVHVNEASFGDIFHD